jgi:hypothetical protein
LWNLCWCLCKARIVLDPILHGLQMYPSKSIWLAWIWLTTASFLILEKPHSRHCHAPLISLIILSSTSVCINSISKKRTTLAKNNIANNGRVSPA